MILVIAHDYPDLSAEGICTKNLVDLLLSKGIPVLVLAGAPPGGSKSSFQQGLLSVEYVPDPQLAHPLHPWRKGYLKAMELTTGVVEQSSLWIKPAVARGQALLKSNPKVKAIYSRAVPGAGNVAGYYLSRRWPLPWIAHFGDPWPNAYLEAKSLVSRNLKRLSFNYWREKIFRRSHALTFASWRLQDYYTSRDPAIGEKSFTLPHLYVQYPHGSEEADRGQENPGETLTLLHCGNLYGLRKPHSLLSGLARVFASSSIKPNQIRLVFCGPAQWDLSRLIRELHLQDSAVALGKVSHEKSLAWQRSADVLVVIEADVPQSPFLPSKLIEYLSFPKPILALTPPDSQVAELLKAQPLPSVDVRDPAAIARAIRQLHSLREQRQLSRLRPSESLINRFSGEIIWATFQTLLGRLNLTLDAGPVSPMQS